MNIKEASQHSGLSVDTIRFYEKAGMLPPIVRDGRGWRRFSADAVEWLRNLERLRATGMPMKEMHRFAVLVHIGDPALPDVAAERLAILERHSERLVQRQADLDACKAYLAKKIKIYKALQEDQT
jgi:MerR family transcriptional regulator, aldehyde-responsive regulator